MTSQTASYAMMRDPLALRLPFGGMPWEQFEELCGELLTASDRSVRRAFRNGSPQQGQGGVDVVALNSSDRYVMIQCKCVRQIRRGDISRWVGAFLERKDLDNVAEFVLACTVDVENDRKLLEEWHSIMKLFAPAQVQPTLWDLKEIEKSLRLQPRLVARFFGNECARRFCFATSFLENWPTEFRERFVSAHDRSVVLENRSLRLDLFVPSESYPSVSAGLSFARGDLSGISLVIDGPTIVSWLQWMAHSSSLANAPFLRPLTRESTFILEAPTARPQMSSNSVEDFEWILREAWTRYICAARSLEERWRALRFPVVRTGSEMFFSLCRVERWFWRAILAYAEEHDFSKGESASHIFDGGAACLKVFVGEARAGLQPGYHLISYGRSDDHNSLWDAGVVIGWQPFRTLSGEPPVYSPELTWDAEHAHHWMMTSLFPAVLEWLAAREHRNRTLLRKLLFTMRSNSAYPPRLEEVAHSRAQSSYSAAALRLVNVGEAVHVARTLRSHFSIYNCEVALQSVLRRQVLELILRLLPSIEEPDRHYIRANLGLESGSLSDEVNRLLRDDVGPLTNGGALDLALRSLIALLEDCVELSTVQLDYASMQLTPLWERWREDRICRLYA